MAPPFSFLLPEGSSKTMVVYLVRSLGLMPESISHDWHVQPSCQRPNRDPPRRCEFSPGGFTQVRNRLSSKPYKHTVRRKSRQSSLPTEFPDDFHNGNAGSEGGRAASEKRIPHDKAVRNDRALSGEFCGGALYAQQYGLPVGMKRHFRRAF
jgi:hypothetical protein